MADVRSKTLQRGCITLARLWSNSQCIALPAGVDHTPTQPEARAHSRL